MTLSCILADLYALYIQNSYLLTGTNPMDLEQLVETLADLFPHKPRSELLERAASCDRIELVIEDLIQEQDLPDSSASSDVGRLQSLFPDTEVKELKRHLSENDNDVQKTVEALVNEDPSLRELKTVTGLTEDDLKPYLQNNPCRMLALAEIMCKHRKKKKVKRSRVQDSRNAASISTVKENRYVCDEAGEEVKSLRQEVYEHQPLQQLNFAFLIKCLEFFEGDVERVIRVAYLFVDLNAVALTFNKHLDLHVAFKPELKAADVLKTAKEPQSWKFTTTLSMNRPKPSANGVKSEYKLPSPSNLVVDLHGYQVKEAVELAKGRLMQWWAEEMEERQAHGILSKFGTKAQFLEPLDVVVGRGLHSSGGPKLRKPVMKMLENNRFVFVEEIGRFRVIGKQI